MKFNFFVVKTNQAKVALCNFFLSTHLPDVLQSLSSEQKVCYCKCFGAKFIEVDFAAVYFLTLPCLTLLFNRKSCFCLASYTALLQVVRQLNVADFLSKIF